jgi:hypothetical protein
MLSFRITRKELEKLELGYSPKEIDELWDEQLVIEGLARIILHMLDAQHDWLLIHSDWKVD